MSETKQLRPSIGRVVHYVAFGSPGGEPPAGAHRAAMITEVYHNPDGKLDTELAGLVVFNPTGQYFNRFCPFDPTGSQPGSWHWPEFVPPA